MPELGDARDVVEVVVGGQYRRVVGDGVAGDEDAGLREDAVVHEAVKVASEAVCRDVERAPYLAGRIAPLRGGRRPQ